MLTKLKKEFKQINKAKFEEEFGNIFLRIEVDLKDIDNITTLSKEISKWLDNQDIDHKYFLEVYSSGAEKTIALDQLSNYKDKYIKVELKTKIKDKLDFVGILTNIDPITIRWNAKGQMRNQNIDKQNISKISTHVKVGK